ncbi:MAG TPA: glycosyltransferase family 87 protein, partial [Blastocatellia bacterium]|nr:glycosyltransferase family 87 protein [Blastocatellia bacterium]
MIKESRLSPPEIRSVRGMISLLAVPFILVTAGLGSAWLYMWGGFLHRFIQGISGYIGMYIAHFAIYLAACYVVFRLPRPPSRVVRVGVIVLVVLFAAIFRAELVGQPPYLSSDTYRYIWDGRVQASGINPYRYVPSAPELEYLREDKIYPKINRGDYAPTPYPPIAQAVYFAVYLIHPLSITAFKVAMSVFDIISILAIMMVLFRLGLDPARAVLFAWHPLLIWEGAHSGHVESVFITFIAVGLLAWAYKRAVLAGCAIGLATMVKFYPALLLPVFMFSGPASLDHPPGLSDNPIRRILDAARGVLLDRRNLRFIAAFAGTVVISYLPYLSVGKGVLGYL